MRARIVAAEIETGRVVLRSEGAEGACAVPEGAEGAALRMAQELVGTPALAQEPEGALRRWLGLSGAGRDAFGAVRAARGALRAALGEAVLAGGAVAMPAVVGSEEEVAADPIAACLDPDRTLIVGDLRCGGPEGVRDLAALARAFDVRLALRPLPGLEALTAEVAAATGAALTRALPAPAVVAGGGDTVVREIRVHRVSLPLRDVYVSAMYLTDTQPRTVVEMRTAGGAVGWGEAGGGVAALVANLAKAWIGADVVRGRAAMRRRFARIGFENRQGRDGYAAFSALDLAAWDAAGRAEGMSLRAMLGDGSAARPVAIACPLPTAVPGRVVDRAELARHMADHGNAVRVAELAAGIAARWGVGAFKYKSAGDAAWDLAVMRALRGALPAARLRWDPNAAYGTEEAVRLCRELEPLGLEFFEDPTDGLEGMARVAAAVRTPLASNMCVLSPEHLAAAARRPGLRVVLGDLFYWGGVAALRDMAAVARLLGLTPALHSFYETAVVTAANAGIAQALGLDAPHPMDCGWPLLAGDIVGEDAFAISGGALTPPEGPGLGVAPDPARLAALATAEPIVVR